MISIEFLNWGFGYCCGWVLDIGKKPQLKLSCSDARHCGLYLKLKVKTLIAI
jgi:hypothetical protein